MRSISILLKENVKDLGMIGDVVSVSPGYARNYLLPRQLAVSATPENVKMLERRRARYEAELAEHEKDVSKRIELLGRLQLRTKQKADDGGNLYGSVNVTLVAQLLMEAGHQVDERDVRLDEPIKTLGAHEVPIHVHGEHYAGVQVVVEPE